MPQNAIIKADGTGDYTTLAAWDAAERLSNYGAPTRCYVHGQIVNSASTVLNTTGGAYPNGAEIFAAVGQEFNGTNASSCARLSFSSNLIEAANVDVYIHGLALNVTGGYNNEVFKTSNTVSTTQRRNISIKNCYIESAPFYHGSTFAVELNTTYASGAGSQYNLDIENLVILARASNRGIYIAGRDGNQTFTGTVKNVTILPTNSGSSTTNAFWIGVGNDSNLVVDKILSIAQEVRTNVTDYVNDGMGGTFTNISTNDATGTVTGVTTTTELENYAAGDYRLKSTGSGNGAFVQSSVATNNLTIVSPLPTIMSSVNITVVVPDFNLNISDQLPSLQSSMSLAAGVPSFSIDVSDSLPTLSTALGLAYSAGTNNLNINDGLPSLQSSVALSYSVDGNNIQIDGALPTLNSSINLESLAPEYNISVVGLLPTLTSSVSLVNGIPSSSISVLETLPTLSSNVNISNLIPTYGLSITDALPSLQSVLGLSYEIQESSITISSDLPTLQSSVGVENLVPNYNIQINDGTLPSLQSMINIVNGQVVVNVSGKNIISIKANTITTIKQQSRIIKVR